MNRARGRRRRDVMWLRRAAEAARRQYLGRYPVGGESSNPLGTRALGADWGQSFGLPLTNIPHKLHDGIMALPNPLTRLALASR